MEVCKVILTIFLGLGAYFEHRERRVPNWLTLPGMALSLGWGVWSHCKRCPIDECVMIIPTIVGIWTAIYIGWLLHLYGAGDAKVLMCLFALFPDIKFLWVLKLRQSIILPR